MEGRILGSYQILERLGAGGQGHVYRALDTALDREIAMKVLPAAFLADPARLKQFQQEAKLLAAASHPNIAAVYAIEEFEGVHFFTQELVPGQTLATLIKAGPLELDDTLEIGRQVAAALETAHERRLIHRDLKPSNVMVKPDGGVKVLDFGLALPVDREDSEDQHAISDSTPTISRTADSVIIGTAPYMSPDQARGRMVDRRTDIWSFACVLYECLTGTRPFQGDTLLDTLSAIVRAEPDWGRLPPGTPTRLIHLLQRCLRKRVGDRLQHIGDARIVIEEIQAGPLRMPGVDAGAASPPRRRSLIGTAVAAAAFGLVVGSMAWAWLQPIPAGGPSMRGVMLFGGARMDVERSSSIDLAPASDAVVYVAGNANGHSMLYTHAMNSFEAEPIPGTEGGENPFYSPDGSWIGFFSGDFKLAKVPVDGGVVVPICDVPVGNWGAVWLPDDTIVYGTYSTGIGLRRVAASGGEPEILTTLDIDAGETNHGWPRLLPDGRRLLFSVTTATGASIAALDLDTGQRFAVLEGADDARYLPPDRLAFTRAGTLFTTAFDLDTLRPQGTPQPAVEGLFTCCRGTQTSYAVGSDGTLVYAPGNTGPRSDHLVWVDRQGNIEPLDVDPGDYGHPRLSPDNARVAYDAARDGRGDIWVYDLVRGTPTRLTNTGDNVMPVWSPDGEQVLFASSGVGEAGLYWHRADGAGDIHPTIISDHSLWPLSWRDKAIAYYELNPETGRDIWIRAGEEATPFQRSRFNERSPMFSPDGHWVAYVSNESGRDEVYVREFGGRGTQHTITNDGGTEPVWSPEGGELFYRSGGWLVSVPVRTGDEFEAGAPTALFTGPFKSEAFAGNQYYDVSRDGRRFLMIQEDAALRGPDRLHVITNFGRDLAAAAIARN